MADEVTRDDAVVETAAPEFPWPPSARVPVLQAFSRTWTESSLHPTRFFRGIPPGLTVGEALLYYLPLAVAVAGVNLFWRSLVLTFGGRETVERLGGYPGSQGIVAFLLSPLLVLAAWWIAAAVVHVLLSLYRGTNSPFRTTLIVFAFAYSPMLLAVVPGLGSVAGAIWMLVLAVIGLREAHRTETWRPATAIGCAFAIMIVIFAIIGIVAAMFGFLADLPR